MTLSILGGDPDATSPLPSVPGESPREVPPGKPASDRVFHVSTLVVGSFVMVVTGAIGAFLGYKLLPTVHRYGFRFFTEANFDPQRNLVGIAAALAGTVEVALVALVIAFPLSLLTALYISEYAPLRLRSILVTVVDVMAAIPSIVYGVWGFFFLTPQLESVARWMHQNLGWIPLFHVTGVDPRAASINNAGGYRYTGSAFDAGVVVAMMVVPLACSIMRNVFAQAPLGERESAYALGATRWGMIRAVVLPYGRGGIIGGTMLGLGRALGETVAVLLVVSFAFDVKIRILETGSVTISSLIADRVGEATSAQLSALLAAGFVLFLMTLVVNTLAAVVVSRSRSGAGVDL